MGINGIPDQMKAIQIVELHKPYKLNTIPTPTSLSPHDLLVKVAVASLCHTDGMVTAGIIAPPSLPQTASHEGTGTIAATGSSVPASSFRVGDRVMCGIGLHFCGRCDECTGPRGDIQYCQQIDGNIGVTADGAFAEYVVADSRSCARLPDAVSFETAAPLACAGCTVWRGIVQAGLSEGQWVGIVGSGGGLGHLGVQFAKAKGLRVVGVDARDEGLELTKKNGADVVVDARKGKEEVVRQVQEATGGVGVDATVNVSDAKSAAALACAVTRLHGLVVQIAQPDEVSVPFVELVFRDIRIHGSLICSPQEAVDMLDAVAKHKVSVHTNPFNGLDKIEQLVELAHSGKMKGKGIIIVDPEQIKAEQKPGLELV
ncbi:GroES-like protein [Viridothelium virens]|uniref:GroES-like protein n=1 Tax=Viridothelium virens TaxID=1048519 RepID=A0A6A6HME1_VIRVR|nr:GroES-like protein [Viridothelium virens]